MGTSRPQPEKATVLADAAIMGPATPDHRPLVPPTPISRGAGARKRGLQAALQVLNDDGLPGLTLEATPGNSRGGEEGG